MISKFAVNKLISLKHHNYFSPLSTFYLWKVFMILTLLTYAHLKLL